MDEAREARRLLASLRAMRCNAADAAEAIESTLLAQPTDAVALRAALDALDSIDAQLPQGALAGLVRWRIADLQAALRAKLDDTPPPAA